MENLMKGMNFIKDMGLDKIYGPSLEIEEEEEEEDLGGRLQIDDEEGYKSFI